MTTESKVGGLRLQPVLPGRVHPVLHPARAAFSASASQKSTRLFWCLPQLSGVNNQLEEPDVFRDHNLATKVVDKQLQEEIHIDGVSNLLYCCSTQRSQPATSGKVRFQHNSQLCPKCPLDAIIDDNDNDSGNRFLSVGHRQDIYFGPTGSAASVFCSERRLRPSRARIFLEESQPTRLVGGLFAGGITRP